MAEHKLLEPVSVDIEKRLAGNCMAFPFRLLDECDEYRFYRDSGRLLREDKKNGQVVHFGYGTNACIYKGMFYCYQWGGIGGDGKVYRCDFDGTNVEYFDFLSNRKVFDGAHNISEDSISNMVVEGNALVIYVSRRDHRDTKYKMVILDNEDGTLDIRKEIISENHKKQETSSVQTFQRFIIPVDALPTYTIPKHKLLHNQKIQKYIKNLFAVINKKPEAMVQLLSEKNLLSTKVATNISLYSFGYITAGLEYSFRNSDQADKKKILDSLYSKFRDYLDNNLLSPSVKGVQRKELIKDIMESNAIQHDTAKLLITSDVFEEDWLEGITSNYLSDICVYSSETRLDIPIKYQTAMLKMLSFSASDYI